MLREAANVEGEGEVVNAVGGDVAGGEKLAAAGQGKDIVGDRWRVRRHVGGAEVGEAGEVVRRVGARVCGLQLCGRVGDGGGVFIRHLGAGVGQTLGEGGFLFGLDFVAWRHYDVEAVGVVEEKLAHHAREQHGVGLDFAPRLLEVRRFLKKRGGVEAGAPGGGGVHGVAEGVLGVDLVAGIYCLLEGGFDVLLRERVGGEFFEGVEDNLAEGRHAVWL